MTKDDIKKIKIVVKALPERFEQIEFNSDKEIDHLYPFKVELYETLYIEPSTEWLENNTSSQNEYDDEWSRIFDEIVQNQNLIFDLKSYKDSVEWNSNEGGEGSAYYIEAHHVWTGDATSFKEAERLSTEYVSNNTSFPTARRIKEEFAHMDIPVEVNEGDILISDIYSLDNDFEDPDDKWERELRKQEEIEREAHRKKVKKDKFINQKLKYKKSKNFDYDGAWITEIDGVKYDIFRDSTSGISSFATWHVGDLSSKHLGISYDARKTLGYTKKEATKKLLTLIWDKAHNKKRYKVKGFEYLVIIKGDVYPGSDEEEQVLDAIFDNVDVVQEKFLDPLNTEWEIQATDAGAGDVLSYTNDLIFEIEASDIKEAQEIVSKSLVFDQKLANEIQSFLRKKTGHNSIEVSVMHPSPLIMEDI